MFANLWVSAERGAHALLARGEFVAFHCREDVKDECGHPIGDPAEGYDCSAQDVCDLAVHVIVDWPVGHVDNLGPHQTTVGQEGAAKEYMRAYFVACHLLVFFHERL